MTAVTAFLGAGEIYPAGAYMVTGEFTDVQVTLRMGIDALDLIRSRGDRIGPVRVCHAHGLVHILVDPDQSAGFDGFPGVLTAADVIDCGDHWGKAPYWIVPEGADAERVAPALLRTVLTGLSSPH